MAHSLANGPSTTPAPEEEFRFSSDLSLEDIRAEQHKFCQERDWLQFHPPRNVLLAMVGEVGELSELFQWRGEVSRGLPEFSAHDKARVGEELSDVLIYLVDLAEQCQVDLPSAVRDKMRKNALKYPAQMVSGRSDKYTSYQRAEENGTGEERQGVGGSVNQREREEGDGSE